MVGILGFTYDSGVTIYHILRNLSHQPYNVSTGQFEAFTASNWEEYAIEAVEEDATGYYLVAISPDGNPALDAGWYRIDRRIQAGGDPAISDYSVDYFAAYYDGESWRGVDAVVPSVSEITYDVWANADKTGYSLSGTAIGIGPTAAMHRTDGEYQCPTGGTVGLYKRVRGWDGEDLQQADVDSIHYTIYELQSLDEDERTAVEGHEGVTVDVASVLFDEVITDSAASNYNFKFIPPISEYPAFSNTGSICLVEFIITPVVGEVIIERFKALVV